MDRPVRKISSTSFRFVCSRVFGQRVCGFGYNDGEPLVVSYKTGVNLDIVCFGRLFPDYGVLAFRPSGGTIRILLRGVRDFKFSSIRIVRGTI